MTDDRLNEIRHAVEVAVAQAVAPYYEAGEKLGILILVSDDGEKSRMATVIPASEMEAHDAWKRLMILRAYRRIEELPKRGKAWSGNGTKPKPN